MSINRFNNSLGDSCKLSNPKTPRELMMDELGLADDDVMNETSSSSSDSEDESPKKTFVAPLGSCNSPLPPAQNEMKQILRETQRKLRVAQSSLLENERNGERRLKIIKKTHGSALARKEALIQDLQDIISEREESLGELRGRLKDCSCGHVTDREPPPEGDGLKRLVQRLEKLQKEHVSLESHHEQVLSELKQVQSEKENLHDELLSSKNMPLALKSPASKPAVNTQLAGQVREMQQRVELLERERLAAQSRSHIEKELQRQVTSLKAELSALTRQHEDALTSHREEVSGLQQSLSQATTGNERLQTELSELKSRLTSSASSHDRTLSDLKSQLTKEKELNKALSSKTKLSQDELTETQQKLNAMTDLAGELEASNDELERHCQSLTTKLVAIEEQRARDSAALQQLGQLRGTLNTVTTSSKSLRRAMASLRQTTLSVNQAMKLEIAQASRAIVSQIQKVSEENVHLVSKYRNEMKLRKKLHNQLVELRGNIRVFCRVRPVIDEDGTGAQAELVVEPDTDDNGVVRVFSRGTWKTFDLDRVFGMSSTQEEVFSEVKALVTSCMDGYNVCIFAYGQTGSGKTFTMEGPSDNPGLNQRALRELFLLVSDRRDDYDYSIVVSVLEIYNECVRDLLSVDPTEKLEIKQGPDGVYVPGLTQVDVSHLEEVNEVFALGHMNRSTGATKMNIHSSRSHALLCITVMGLNRTTGIQTIGKLNLIDLAGSERLDKSGSDGARLEEAKHINKSLSSLGDVIHHLRAKSPHTPYRNSKLTYLLQDSLCGDSKSLMMVQIAPVDKNASETVCSLNFAQRVRVVELGQATKKTSNSTPKMKRNFHDGFSSSPFKNRP